MNADTWNRLARLEGESFFENRPERVVTKDVLLRLLAMAAEAGSNATLKEIYPVVCGYCEEGESDLTYYSHFFADGWYHGPKERDKPCMASRVRYAVMLHSTTK